MPYKWNKENDGVLRLVVQKIRARKKYWLIPIILVLALLVLTVAFVLASVSASVL